MLGSAFEAEDAVQETMLRAWRSIDRFEGRSALKSWLYRIATNVCLDMLDGRKRRARPMDLSGARHARERARRRCPRPHGWSRSRTRACCRTAATRPSSPQARETLRLAFVNALQHLPARQRAVLILREVLRWSASGGRRAARHERRVGEQRAAAGAGGARRRRRGAGRRPSRPSTTTSARCSTATSTAFEAYDMDSLVALLHEDATMSMPPLRRCGCAAASTSARWMLAPGRGCQGSRLIPTTANGMPAYGQYRASAGGGFEPWALGVLEISGGRITGLNTFLDTARLFPLFGLPARARRLARR